MASSSSGHGYLDSELPPSSADSQPPAADQLEVRQDLSSETVFRLHILGKRDWDKSQINEARVEQLVREAFDVTPDTEITIKSLADHPVRKALVATLNFSQIPIKISQTSPLLQEFDETVEELSLDLDTHFHGFTPLHSGTSTEYTRDFIALSGLGGHAFGSFKRRGGDFMWLRDDLPISIPDARVFVYGYDTRLPESTSFQTLEDLGLALKNALKSLLQENLKSQFMNPLILLGHSLGGLILKEALCQMSANLKEDDEALLKSIRAILFFGTPNQGMDITSLIPMVEGQANENFLRSLGTDSADLRRQAQQWSKALDSAQSGLFFNDLEITSYYETCTSRTAMKDFYGSWTMSGPRVTLVNRSSATHGRPWETDKGFVEPIDRDHSELVKFRHRNDPVYVNHVLPRLRSCLDDHQHEKRQLHLTEKQKACLSSLDFPDRVSRQDQIMAARDDTCEWLLQHHTYMSWVQGSEGLLWLEGHPGSGKSTLTKHAVDATNTGISSKNVVLTHFFHGRGSEIQKSALGLVRSLTYQLLKSPNILRNFSACWTDIWRKYQEIEPYTTWKLEWLYSFLEKQLRRACTVQPIFIFIDALDECEEEDRDYLPDFLADSVRGLGCGRLKIFVSCRHYPNLFSEGYRIQTEINNADDIAIFVESRLQTMHEKKRSVLAKEIISNARGNFQWAQIVTRQSMTLHRKGRTAADIQEKIRQLPKDIHELYDSLFKDADAEDLELANRLFHWLCFAKQPLSIREVQYVIMLSPDTKERSIEEICHRTDFREELDDMVNTVTDVSRGLAEIPVYQSSVYSSESKGDNANQPSWSSNVQLIHQTVRDYLMDTGLEHMDRGRQGNFGSSRDTADHYIFRSCLRYVMMDDFVSQDEVDTPMSRSALHPYIFQFFEQHLVEFHSGATDQSELIEILGWPYNRTSVTKLAVALGMRTSGETFDDICLPSTFFDDKGPVRHFYLLHWSAKKGLAGIVKAIVRRRFDQAQEEHHPGRAPSSTLPLGINTLEVQDMFLDGYYNVNVTDYLGLWSALRGAIIKGHVSVVRELMQSPVIDPNVQDPLGRTPLHDANSNWIYLDRSKDRHEIVRILLDHPRINVALQDRDGRTALFDAVDGNDMEILKMTLNASNACINAKDIFENTALSQAANHGYVNAVELFIHCGYCTEESLQHAYSVAQTKGHVAVQEKILSRNRIHHGAQTGPAEPVEEDAIFFRAFGTLRTPLRRQYEKQRNDLVNVGSWMDNEEDDNDPLDMGSWMRNQMSTDLTHVRLLVDNQEESIDLSMVRKRSTWLEDWGDPTGTGSPGLFSTQPGPAMHKRRRLR